jgi:hypothetical protein
VTFKSPEQELVDFLAPYGPWLERHFWCNASLDDLSTLSARGLGFANIQADRELRERYEVILRRIPARWRDYCKAQERFALQVLGPPSGQVGAPRKDALAEEAIMLKAEGQSWEGVNLFV